jgi:hypothetical protein
MRSVQDFYNEIYKVNLDYRATKIDFHRAYYMLTYVYQSELGNPEFILIGDKDSTQYSFYRALCKIGQGVIGQEEKNLLLAMKWAARDLVNPNEWLRAIEALDDEIRFHNDDRKLCWKVALESNKSNNQ